MVTPKPPKAATYAYGTHPRQRLDAYWHPGTARQSRTGQAAQPGRAPGPAVLVFHGGSWISGDKSSWKYFARRLTAQGYTVFAANYRLATQAVWPAQRDDAGAALDFVKKNAARWNIDPDRIAVVGSSAGGLLASQLGTYGEGAQRVRGVLALSPVNTPYLAYQDGLKATATASQRGLRRAVAKLVGCVPNESDPLCWQRVEDSDSVTHVSSGDAPLLAMHAADELVPASQSNGLAAALRGAGVPADVKVVPGTGHASQLLNDPTVYPAILNWLKARTR
jgi:acetyl esterase/lipase